MQTVRLDMAKLMAAFLECPLASLKDLANGSRIAVALWKVNREQFPFYDANSALFISNRKSSDSLTLSEYQEDNKRVWLKIVGSLAAAPLEGMQSLLEDFEAKYLERAVEGDEDALEYFWLLFFDFLSRANYLVYRKFEAQHRAILARLQQAASQFDEGAHRDASRSPTSGSLAAHNGPRSAQLIAESPARSNGREGRRDYLVTDKSIQDLVGLIEALEGQLQLVREDLLIKERENCELKDRLSALKAEKKQLHEEGLAKDKSIERLAFKVDKLELAVDESWDREDRLKLLMSSKKIEDLETEIDELQKKNAFLQRRIDDLLLVQSLQGTPEQLESEDKQRSAAKTLTLENELLKDKLKILEQGADSLTVKLLKEKETSSRLAEQVQDCGRQLTQKEIGIKSLASERDSLLKENQHLREVIQFKDSQFRGLEQDFSKIVDSGEQAGKRAQLPADQAAEDSVLELVKVCKEVNRYYKEELMCLYNLFHDHFVNQLTGSNLDDLVKKKLAELNRANFAV